jgi:S-DNA-T family DNA segregation ATPase FtsK/SpoIIIE
MWDYGKGNGLTLLVAVLIFFGWPILLIAIPAALAWYVLRPTIKAAWRHKTVTMIVCTVTILCARLGVVEGLGFGTGVTLVVVLDLVLLRLWWPEEFTRYVVEPWARARRRRQLARSWVDVMVGHGLAYTTTVTRLLRRPKRVTVHPHLKVMRMGRHVDRLVIRPVFGQTVEHWARSCEALAITYGAIECRTGLADRGHVFLDIVRDDPLGTIIAALPIKEQVDLAAVPVGMCEDGTCWTVRLDGNHLLVAGTTGSGKGSVLWSILRALGPAIRDGWVQVWAVDPKGGQELYPGRALFHRYADDNPTAMVELLEAAVAAMESRSKRYRGRLLRRHRTSVDEPLVVIVVDELADLTTLSDRKLKDRAAAAISTLLRKGRAVGFTVVAAVQDPAKDVVPFRQLIPTRIGLRLSEKGQVPMVLGEGMREAGGYCDRIPHPGAEGVAYVVNPRRREPVRVRAAWVTDADILDMAAAYPAPVNVTSVDDDHDDNGGPEGGSPVTLLPPARPAEPWRDAA